jgi:hypothetical protein
MQSKIRLQSTWVYLQAHSESSFNTIGKVVRLEHTSSVLYAIGIQPWVRVPPGVREDILGRT